jgi:hypothetical protein
MIKISRYKDEVQHHQSARRSRVGTVRTGDAITERLNAKWYAYAATFALKIKVKITSLSIAFKSTAILPMPAVCCRTVGFLQITPNCLPTFAKAAMTLSNCSSVWVAM